MSILNVEHLTHGFGDRAIFQMFLLDFLKENISDLLERTEKASLLS